MLPELVPKIILIKRTAEKAEGAKEGDEAEDQSENDFLDMSWPKGDWKKQAIYIFFLGITGPLYLFIPDVRREGKEKWVVFTFLNSIIAIAVYRYSQIDCVFIVYVYM